MDSHPRVCSVSCPSSATNNKSPSVGSVGRIGEVKRVTRETNVSVKINLDGTGIADSTTGIPFLDHMLDQLASHGLFDVYVRATGDLHIDDHHTNEDVALAIGTALLQALTTDLVIFQHLLMKHLYIFLCFDFAQKCEILLYYINFEYLKKYERKSSIKMQFVPNFQLDLSGRPQLSFDLQLPTQRVGTYDTQLAGRNTHHIIEATFKAFARALRQATEYDMRRQGSIPRKRILKLLWELPVPKECCPALDEAALFTRHKPSNIIFKLLEFIP